MNRIIDAYQNIVAPEGFEERIEARIMSTGHGGESERTVSRRGRWRRLPVIAFTAGCLLVAAIGVGQWNRGRENLSGIRLAMEEGEILFLAFRRQPKGTVAD